MLELLISSGVESRGVLCMHTSLAHKDHGRRVSYHRRIVIRAADGDLHTAVDLTPTFFAVGTALVLFSEM